MKNITPKVANALYEFDAELTEGQRVTASVTIKNSQHDSTRITVDRGGLTTEGLIALRDFTNQVIRHIDQTVEKPKPKTATSQPQA